MTHRLYQTSPAPATAYFIFDGRIFVSMAIWVHPLSLLSFWAGAGFGTRQTDYIPPFSFCTCTKHWFHNRSKSKNKRKKAKQASINRLNYDFCPLIHFCPYHFPFLLRAYFPFFPRKHAKIDGVYVMGEQKPPWCGRPMLSSTLFFFSYHWSITLCDTLFIPQFPYFGSPFEEWLFCKSFITILLSFQLRWEEETWSSWSAWECAWCMILLTTQLQRKVKQIGQAYWWAQGCFYSHGSFFPHLYSFCFFVFSVCVVFFISVFVVLQLQFVHRINKEFVSCERNMTLLLWSLVLLFCGGRLIDIHPSPLTCLYLLRINVTGNIPQL